MFDKYPVMIYPPSAVCLTEQPLSFPLPPKRFVKTVKNFSSSIPSLSYRTSAQLFKINSDENKKVIKYCFKIKYYLNKVKFKLILI